MSDLGWIVACSIAGTVVLGVTAFIGVLAHKFVRQLDTLAASFERMAQASDHLANNMHGLVPNLKQLGENLEKHVIHMGGLVAVIEAANRGQPPPIPVEPPKPGEENFNAVMPPQVDWDNPDGNGSA